MYLTVPPKLDLSKVQETMIVKAGTTIHMDVPYKATPRPDVKWVKDGMAVQPTATITLDTSDRSTILTAKNCTKSDEGVYVLTVRIHIDHVCYMFIFLYSIKFALLLLPCLSRH